MKFIPTTSDLTGSITVVEPGNEGTGLGTNYIAGNLTRTGAFPFDRAMGPSHAPLWHFASKAFKQNNSKEKGDPTDRPYTQAVWMGGKDR